MREIRFRGKATRKGEWVYGDLIQLDEHLYMAGVHQWATALKNNSLELGVDEVIIETIGQFSGLKDKNGIDIYEGDIVKWDDQSSGKYWRFAVVKINPDIQFDCGQIKEVDGFVNSGNIPHSNVFNFGSFAYKNTHDHLIIIGNIFDNPELLEL